MSDTLIGLLSTMLGAGGLAAILQTVRWWKDREHEHVPQGLMDISKIYNILQQAKDVTDASRVVLLKLHNGGGRPQAGNSMYSTALYEVYCDGQTPIAQNWQAERIDNDGQYREMVIEMYDNGITRLSTHEMPQSKLRDLYERVGVARSIVKSVGGKQNE